MAESNFWTTLGEELGEFFGDPYKAGVLSATDADVVFMDPSEINSPEEYKQALEDHEPGLSQKFVDVARERPFLSDMSSEETFETYHKILENIGPHAINIPGSGSCIVAEPGPDWDTGQEILSGAAGEDFDSSHLDGDDVVRGLGVHEGTHCNQHGGIFLKEEVQADEAAMRDAVARGAPDVAKAFHEARQAGQVHDPNDDKHHTAEHIDIGSIIGHDTRYSVEKRAVEGVEYNPEIH